MKHKEDKIRTADKRELQLSLRTKCLFYSALLYLWAEQDIIIIIIICVRNHLALSSHALYRGLSAQSWYHRSMTPISLKTQLLWGDVNSWTTQDFTYRWSLIMSWPTTGSRCSLLLLTYIKFSWSNPILISSQEIKLGCGLAPDGLWRVSFFLLRAPNT